MAEDVGQNIWTSLPRGRNERQENGDDEIEITNY